MLVTRLKNPIWKWLTIGLSLLIGVAWLGYMQLAISDFAGTGESIPTSATLFSYLSTLLFFSLIAVGSWALIKKQS